MEYDLCVVVEKVAAAGKKAFRRETLATYEIDPPESILDLRLRHEAQIALLAKVQDALLAEQSPLIALGDDICAKCGQKLSKNGFMKSKVHAVFSDHQLFLQKHCCKNPDCHWQRSPTRTTVFGTDIHPDLAKLQYKWLDLVLPVLTRSRLRNHCFIMICYAFTANEIGNFDYKT